MGAKETNLTKKIENWWTKQGALVLKYHGNNFTRQGVPDLLICYDGIFISIEVKVGDNKPTPIQIEMMRRIEEDYQGIAFWVNETNWEELCSANMEYIDNQHTWDTLSKGV